VNGRRRVIVTTLNCRGHRVLPSSAGMGTTLDTYVPSVPAVAVAITGDRGVDVRNCIIGEDGVRFDFGIVAINSKQAGRFGHRIHNNQIHARDSAITFLRVDDAQVNDNIITWSSGFGISFARDSDRNRVTSNTMSSPGSPPATSRLVPDGPFRNVADDGIFLVTHYFQPLYNLVIAGRLYQFPNSEDGQYASHEDNILDGNRLSLPGSSAGKSHQAIEVGSNALRTRVTGNIITEAGIGIRLAGLRPAQTVSRPGRCVNAEGHAEVRFCQTDADCWIPAIDVAPVGTCSGLVEDVRDLRARDTVVEDNTLVGPFNSTATAMRAGIFGGNGTVGGIIRTNHIFGTGIEPGITLAGNMIQTGEVTGNVVQGASFGLMLQQGAATSFGARVFLNDIVDSTIRAVGVFGTYSLETDLSWDGVGNYWGHAVPPCFRSSDSPIPGLIQDAHPFCLPVARSSKRR
jgi:nitrous oxidase accessory protein NosD